LLPPSRRRSVGRRDDPVAARRLCCAAQVHSEGGNSAQQAAATNQPIQTAPARQKAKEADRTSDGFCLSVRPSQLVAKTCSLNIILRRLPTKRRSLVASLDRLRMDSFSVPRFREPVRPLVSERVSERASEETLTDSMRGRRTASIFNGAATPVGLRSSNRVYPPRR
jgi:hypothetical protein